MSEPPEAPAAAAGNKIPEGDGVAARKMPGNSPNSGSSSSSSPSRRRIPLKTILQNFLNHVDALEAEKHDSECSNGGSLYEKEFQQLKAFSDSLKLQSDFSCKEGELEVNRKKNRYKDILPFDCSRVKLSEYPGVPGSDYINANYVKGASGSNAYIASQGPLPHTVNDFWRMVVETEVQVIVMACNETEAGKHKCERYWSNDDDDDEQQPQPGDDAVEHQFGKFFVKVLKQREICPDFLVRTMRLRWTNDKEKEEERTVCQFHYSAWPDHGIPTQVKPLLEMVRLIRDCQASETLPVLIHCSAGCGRTGTICAIDYIWGLLRTGKLTSDFSLFELVKQMRRQRIAMVQTPEQYILVHRAVKELFLEQLRVIDSHPYENVDDDGHPLAANAEEIAADYETIFVKEQDIDKILSEKMMINQNQNINQQQHQQQSPKTVMGVQMLSRDSKHSSTTSSDSSSSRRRSSKNDELTRRSEPVLYEPLTHREPQRFNKGNLRLTKTDSGWKLEEVEGKKSPGDKKNSKKKNSIDDLSKSTGDLLRKPSIKKIRAFFKNDKENSSPPKSASTMDLASASSSSSSSANNSSSNSSLLIQESSPQSDTELASALSKLPKFPDDEKISSQSVPNSLDRRQIKMKEPEYANVEQNKRPSLPVKRSKSMIRQQSAELRSSTVDVEDELSRLHSRLLLRNRDDSALSGDLKKSLPLIARSSNSLDETAKKMLKDCQDYLRSSLEMTSAEFYRGVNNRHNDYENVGSNNESTASSSLPRRERRNSFREAVEKKEEQQQQQRQAYPQKGYEKIWFGQQQQQQAQPQQQFSSPKKNFGTPPQPQQQLSPKRSPTYANSGMMLPPQPPPQAQPSPKRSPTYANSSVISTPQQQQQQQRRRSYDPPNNSQQQQQHPVSGRRNVISGTYDNVDAYTPPNPQSSFNNINKKSPSQLNSALQNTPMNSGTNNGGTSDQLQSVSLVQAMMSKQSVVPTTIGDKFFQSASNNSNSRMMPPPPYKEPPQPFKQQKPYPSNQGNFRSSPSHHQQQHQFNGSKVSPPENNGTYVNVRVKKRHSREERAKDDMVLRQQPPPQQQQQQHQYRQHKNKRSSSQNPNRFSCGDFSSTSSSSQAPQSLPNHLYTNLQGLQPAANSAYPQQSQSMVNDVKSPPGVDIDSVAAAMSAMSTHRGVENNTSSSSGSSSSSTAGSGSNPHPPNSSKGRFFNFRSRFSNNSSSTNDSAGGINNELPPSSLPVTVPGAVQQQQQKQPVIQKQNYGYPNRLDARPSGPREPPAHFQRKQEYL